MDPYGQAAIEPNGWQETRRLPDDLRVNGRLIWEPPILDYRSLTDPEKNVKERDAFIKFYDGDVARGTDAWDAITECYILDFYVRWIASTWAETSHNGSKAFYDDLASEVTVDTYAANTDRNGYNIVLIPEVYCGIDDICVVRNNDFQKSLRAMYLAEVSRSPETLYLGPPVWAAPFTNVTNERRYMINHMLSLVTEKEQLKWLATCGPTAGPTAEELALADFEGTERSQENEKQVLRHDFFRS